MEMKQTLFGMEQFLQKKSDSLFKDIVLPEGINKETLIDSIIFEYGENCPLYSDWKYMKFCTEVFFKKWYSTFEKWIADMLAEYNPVENYDRYEEGTDVLEDEYDSTMTKDQLRKGSENTTFNNLKDTKSGSVIDKPHDWEIEHYAQDYDTKVKENSKTTQTNGVSAYDDSGFSNQSQATVTVTPNTGSTYNTETTVEFDSTPETTEQSGTYEVEDTTATTRTGGYSQENDIGKIEDSHDGTDTHTTTYGKHIHGNIGVVSATNLIQEDILMRLSFNLYQGIADMYQKELIILI